MKMSPRGSCVFLFESQLVSLFREVMTPLEGGTLLEEVNLQGRDSRPYPTSCSFSLLPVCQPTPFCRHAFPHTMDSVPLEP